MAGQNTVLFLFNQNDLKQIDQSNKITFAFGEPTVPCEYPIQIDNKSNLFAMGCNCHLIDYDTNIISIDCDPRIGAPPCMFWDEHPGNDVSFNCPCIPWEQQTEDTPNVDFNFTCTTEAVPQENIILGTSRNYFGTTSDTSFAVIFATSISVFGYNSTHELSVADMRISIAFTFGIDTSVILTRQAFFNVDYQFGYEFRPNIVFDPFNKLFGDTEYAAAHFGYVNNTTVVFDPFNKFFVDDEYATTVFGIDANSQIIYNPYHKFTEDDLVITWGLESRGLILFDEFNKLSNSDINMPFGFQSNAFVLYDQYTQLLEGDITAYFGLYNPNTIIVYNPYHVFSEEDLTIPYGFSSFATILFDQYTILWDEALTFIDGFSSTTTIVYDPYHPFLEEHEYAAAGFGYAPHTTLVYDPYHEFFSSVTDSATAAFGHSANSVIVYNPYHLFFNNINDSAESVFGYELKNVFVFNPYNQFNPGSLNPFVAGWSTLSDMRYNDDHRITPDDINLATGYSSSSDMKLANIYANVGTSLAYGFSSSNQMTVIPGFVGTIGFGFATNIKYLTYRIPYPVLGICIAGFGYELHENGSRPRFFDLSAGVCCTKKQYELLNIEMTDQEDWATLYGNEHGWGIASIASLCTQPRMSSTMHFGVESEIIDNAIYFNNVEFGFGTSMHTRGMQFDSVIDLVIGNFITDQDEIKVELTKPGDEVASSVSMYFGMTWHTNLGVPYMLTPTDQHYGAYSTFELRVDEALRGTFIFGVQSSFRLNNTSRMSANEHFGYSSVTQFYEPPYYMHFGMVMECEAIITENWVEFLEEGELNNDYLFQTKDGDVDHTRPNGESLEGYPYTRYIKGRCY